MEPARSATPVRESDIQRPFLLPFAGGSTQHLLLPRESRYRRENEVDPPQWLEPLRPFSGVRSSIHPTNWGRESSRGKGQWRCYRRLKIFCWTDSDLPNFRAMTWSHSLLPASFLIGPYLPNARTNSTYSSEDERLLRPALHSIQRSAPSPITQCSCFIRYLYLCDTITLLVHRHPIFSHGYPGFSGFGVRSRSVFNLVISPSTFIHSSAILCKISLRDAQLLMRVTHEKSAV